MIWTENHVAGDGGARSNLWKNDKYNVIATIERRDGGGRARKRDLMHVFVIFGFHFFLSPYVVVVAVIVCLFDRFGAR